MSKIRILYILVVYAFILLLSCNSKNSGKNDSDKIGQNDSLVNQKYFAIKNESMDIGNVDMIYISYTDWDWDGNVTFGVDDETIDRKFQEMIPDSIENINDLPMGYKPRRTYLKQDVLNYLSKYIIGNCDTLIYERNYEDGNTIYNITLSGNKGKINCIYGDPKRVKEYFEGMLEWIKLYSDTNAFQVTLPIIESFINNP